MNGVLRRCVVLLVLVAPTVCAGQTPDDRCPGGSAFGNATSITREISDFRVRIYKQERGCAFEVRYAGGKPVVAGADAQIEVLPEMYVLRIGTNDLVIETYSGGAHCCWT